MNNKHIKIKQRYVTATTNKREMINKHTKIKQLCNTNYK